MKKEHIFYFFNIVLLFLMILFVYYPRNKAGIVPGFVYLYVFLVIAASVIGFFIIRKATVPILALILLQIGLLLHYMGGLAIFGERLYSQIILGIPYDKIVHFYNSFAGLIGLKLYLDHAKISLKGHEPLALLLIITGIGAIVEIIEYVGVKTLPIQGVWHYAIPFSQLYDNNLMDMVANLLGAGSALVFVYASGLFRRKA